MKNYDYKSVVILMTVYNGEKWIVEQVRSILNQKNTNVSIYISMDSSSDNTEEICLNLASTYTNIHILPVGLKFGSAAPNFFRLISDVNLTGFDYIAYADQDDIWNDDKLLRASSTMEKNGYDGYSSNVVAFWSGGKKKIIDKSQPQVKWDYLFESAGPGCTFVLSNKLALSLQNFVIKNKEQMKSVWMHDWFTYAYARSYGFIWHIDDYPSMLYRQHNINQVGANTGYKAFIYRAHFILSGKALEQSVYLASLCGLADSPFVKKWHDLSRWGVLRLSFNANKCRRKYSEKVFFMLSCLLLVLIGNKKS